ncbi:KAP family P-loop NTPase fold protein [Sinorhizobium sp. 22678]|uniref:KAP family P-loop NTPase fold protein n=1 Tax=Sinorhizobium sp. 22678 TaxID=3453955 RepID=UPI003F83645A
MKIYPKPMQIGDEEGFSAEKDLFGRAQLAGGMSNLVSTVEDPLVIAFDGAWGSGKTTFLRMWAGELRKVGFPVVLFDAFENDYVEDAFAALARELVELAEDKTSVGNKAAQSFREKAVNLGSLLLRGAAKVGTKAAVRAATAGILKAEDVKEVAEDLTSEAETMAEAYMNQLLDRPRKQKETVESFRDALTALPSLLAPATEGEKQRPLIYIIDELDRCKPLFALALLERIKHFMSVPNVHFVLGTHLRQLEGSVRFAYGSDIDASAYLQKFINLTISNVEFEQKHQPSDFNKYADFLVKELGLRSGSNSPLQPAIETIIRIIRYDGMSFRTLERAFTVLALAVSFTPSNHLQLGGVMGGLVMMKLSRPDLFRKAKRGVLTLPEVKAFLRFAPEEDADQKMGWEEMWWTYLLSDTVPDHLSDFGRELRVQYHIRDRSDVIRYTANNVIDRLSPPSR